MTSRGGFHGSLGSGSALRGIRDETERSVKGVLGEKGFTSYERNNGAYWLKGIAPDAPTPTKQP